MKLRLCPGINRDHDILAGSNRPSGIDGDLSEWKSAGAIRAQGSAPIASAYKFEGMMLYDSEFLYLAAHVTDPSPMRSVVDPATDGDTGWKGGGLQVRLCADRALGWPIDANADIYYQGTSMKLRPEDTNDKIVHLTMWYYAPGKKECLHIAHGMDFHGTQTNPAGYRGAFRKDADGRGYTMEYAIPWSLLGAEQPLRSGDIIPVTWSVHWSDDSGRLWRGQLIELHHPSEPLRNNNWGHALSWGRAFLQ